MNESEKIKFALKKMKESGLKYTKKREELLCFLAKHNRYLSAKEIQIGLQKKFPNVSFDTIYRNLHDCASLGLLEFTELNGEKRYRIDCELGQENRHHHHHFICTSCEEIQEIDYCPIEEMVHSLGDVEVTGHKVEIFGKCQDCTQKTHA